MGGGGSGGRAEMINGRIPAAGQSAAPRSMQQSTYEQSSMMGGAMGQSSMQGGPRAISGSSAAFGRRPPQNTPASPHSQYQQQGMRPQQNMYDKQPPTEGSYSRDVFPSQYRSERFEDVTPAVDEYRPEYRVRENADDPRYYRGGGAGGPPQAWSQPQTQRQPTSQRNNQRPGHASPPGHDYGASHSWERDRGPGPAGGDQMYPSARGIAAVAERQGVPPRDMPLREPREPPHSSLPVGISSDPTGSASAGYGANAGQPEQPGASGPDFSNAIEFVATIKLRYKHEPAVYTNFLSIMQTYHRNQIPIEGILMQLAQLFHGNVDLLRKFSFFLPDEIQENAAAKISQLLADTDKRYRPQEPGGRPPVRPTAGGRMGMNDDKSPHGQFDEQRMRHQAGPLMQQRGDADPYAAVPAMSRAGGGPIRGIRVRGEADYGMDEAARPGGRAGDWEQTERFTSGPPMVSQKGYYGGADRGRTSQQAPGSGYQNQYYDAGDAQQDLTQASLESRRPWHDSRDDVSPSPPITAAHRGGVGSTVAPGGAGYLQAPPTSYTESSANLEQQQHGFQASGAPRRISIPMAGLNVDAQHGHAGIEPQADVAGVGMDVDLTEGQAQVDTGAEGEHYTIASERDLLQQMKSTLAKSGGEEAEAEFLKCMDLFSKKVVSLPEMMQLIGDLFGSVAASEGARFIKPFRELLASRRRSDASSTGHGVPTRSAYVAHGGACTPSYRALPANYRHARCSGRSAADASVLNDGWISVAVGSETTAKPGTHADALYRVEEERCEVDVVISTAEAAVARLEQVVEDTEVLRQMKAEEGGVAMSLVLDSLALSAVHLSIISKVYGEQGSQVVELLKESPTAAAPVILRRLRSKVEEWKRVQIELSRSWKEASERHYQKALDRRGAKIKSDDMFTTTTQYLLAEMQDSRKAGARPNTSTITIPFSCRPQDLWCARKDIENFFGAVPLEAGLDGFSLPGAASKYLSRILKTVYKSAPHSSADVLPKEVLCTTSLYLFLRVHAVILGRLLEMCQASRSAAAAQFPNGTLVQLQDDYQECARTRPLRPRGTAYTLVKGLIHARLCGSIGSERFESAVLNSVGPIGCVVYCVDKLLLRAADHLRAAAADPFTERLLQCDEKDASTIDLVAQCGGSAYCVSYTDETPQGGQDDTNEMDAGSHICNPVLVIRKFKAAASNTEVASDSGMESVPDSIKDGTDTRSNTAQAPTQASSAPQQDDSDIDRNNGVTEDAESSEKSQDVRENSTADASDVGSEKDVPQLNGNAGASENSVASAESVAEKRPKKKAKHDVPSKDAVREGESSKSGDGSAKESTKPGRKKSI